MDETVARNAEDKTGGVSGEEAQRAVVALLEDPATHGGQAVERVDTHISRIFLAGDRAWKLKRAIRTNYLDFATPEKRGWYCRREVDLNRVTADFYLGVVPVTRQGDHLGLGGAGEPVDWLVEMRRFDRDQELDRLAETGRLTRGLVERLADAVAAFHTAAPITPGFGDAADVRARIDQIGDALQTATADLPFAGDVTAWRSDARARCDALGATLDRRCRLGRMRRCHGDLHLGNIVLIGERPTLFDAIEFNEAIASIDVLYDLALALTDLLMRDLGGLANVLLNRYLGATRDYSGVSLLPLYLSIRGAVRAMVAASRGAADEAAHDFGFARAVLPATPERRLIAIGGISGSGKSTLAQSLAPLLAPLTGAVVVRSDVVRKRRAGCLPEEPLPPPAYSTVEGRRVLARMAFDARVALRAGAAVVLDATFLRPAARACVRDLARIEGVPFDGIWLETVAEDAARRVTARPADASDATASVVLAQAQRAGRPVGWTQIDGAEAPDEVVRAAMRALSHGSKAAPVED